MRHSKLVRVSSSSTNAARKQVTGNLPSISGWVRLYAAIVNSGVQTNDVEFLASEWCAQLTNAVKYVCDFCNERDLIPKKYMEIIRMYNKGV